MKKNILLSFLFILSAFASSAQVTINPSTFNVTDQITITVSFASATCNTMGTNPVKVYMHAGIGNEANAFGFSVVGNWAQDDGVGLMTNNGNGTWSTTITPSTYFNINATQQAAATRMGMVFRNATGTQTLKKPTSCGDFIFNVGYFQTTLISPAVNSTTILASGSSLNIQASNTNGVANYNLKANGVSINSSTAASSYTFNHTNITENQNYELEIAQGTSVQIKKFAVLINPGIISDALPAGKDDGINYDASDVTKAILVLDAPGKDFIVVAGSFNNWQPTSAYDMKKDPASGKFWLELTGLTPGTDYTYQYWVVDTTPIASSPVLVKTADPYSTLVLSPFDDPYIPSTSYPNIPAYPTGQEREVTVLHTNQTPYNWQVTNFVKPAKEDLVVYEALVRDFDSHRTYQDLIDKIDYFKNLKINAIELMPVMEFEGDESWGYNSSFHLANDKFYGPADKLREFIDLCHQNGIAVILDVALNHAFGRNPMVRMWMNDPDGDGWGGPSTENPYFNITATHSYSVGNDFNHSQPRTKNYVKRVIKNWIENYHIDGFRWDLTKGFTQNATGSDSATNGFQQDRINVLHEYADYSWSLDPTHYTIFEHLGYGNSGGEEEERQYANYRIDETPSKGIMLWEKNTAAYNQLSMGFATGDDISAIGSTAHGFTKYRAMGYAESHDEERLMYKNLTYGNSSNSSHNVRDLNTALSRMSAIGAIELLVPGPKMIWHFADLGWNLSVFSCNNGTVNTDTDATSGDCKLDTKPQPQWTNNWLSDVNRFKIYNDWSRMIDLKENQAVFHGSYALNSSSTNLTPRLYVYDNSLPSTALKNVVVLTNFNVTTQSITPDFPYTGTWYNLMDNSSFEVTSTTSPISIPAGQFFVYGNKPVLLNTDRFEANDNINIYPNPTNEMFMINANVSQVQVFAITGQLVKKFGTATIGNIFDISDLNAGVYLVKITDSNNRDKTVKLIRQ